ncbi:U-scoloptoxin(05)-Er3a-like [Branchiostoma floridae]|uniref:U-scoloptoxin(05)-Er3a-like n=1 Tax=Branchiostoma floridae TaxID=7739 RepID=A0A9J7LKB1_BRAFL|nr:U-scoloptoxin(05)-Er3a-like [Branchiostoma floridae]
MKGFLFVAAFALAWYVTTCGALKCPRCTLLDSRAACLRAAQVTCSGNNPYCKTTQTKNPLFSGEKWANACATKAACDSGKAANPRTCKPTEATSVCVYCCNTDGCVGAASAARVSIVTMATAALAVLLKNAAGF